MTQEEKAKKYDDAIERAKGIYKDTWNGYILKIFPELAESEDERIRKTLIRFHKSTIDMDGIKGEEILAWLEKQGEQKPVDEAEPKFHEGDWVVHNKANFVFKVVSVGSNGYEVVNRDNYKKTISFDNDVNYHLWTIEDAKEGDVLVYGDNPADHHLRIIMLFKSMRNFNSAFNHFHIFDDEFRINEWCDCGKTAHPATKEQRDLLFSKMHEAGYEWNADKKEVKKIEEKPKWTDEDDYNVQCCIAKAKRDIADGNLGRNKELIDWLTSLKQRMEEQQ